MKLNKLFLGLLCTAAFAFTSCSEDETYPRRGEGWESNAGYADIYFPVSGTDGIVELNPVDPTQLVIKVARRDSVGQKTVKFYAAENTDDVFQFETATFEDTQWETDLVVNFPDAEIGKTYNLVLTTNDPDAVSQYTADIVYSASIQRVKWNPAGFYYASDGSKVEGYGLYGDDAFTHWWGVDATYLFPVKVEERDDKPGYFRVENPYGEAYPWNDPGDWDDSQLKYLYIDATNPNKVYFPERLYTTTDWGYGEFVIWDLAGYYKAQNNDDAAEDFYGTYAHGEIRFPVNALLIAMLDYQNGGLYQANNNGLWRLILNPDELVPEEEPLYELSIEDDFKFETVFEGVLTSAKLGAEIDGVSLEVGVPTVDTDEADVRFAEEVGTLYRINSPYAEGYHILFIKNPDGDILVPEGYELQPIGLQALGDDVYAKLNSKGNSISANEVVLNITFQNRDGSLLYGTTDEVLAHIEWDPFAVGTVYYNFWSDSDDELMEDPGYNLLKRADKDNVFKIEDYGYADFLFQWNRRTNAAYVPEQYVGYDHPSYGPMYMIEGADYDSSFGASTSYYDPETRTFHFFPVYFVDAGYFGQFEELFEITEGGEVKHKATRRLSKNLPGTLQLKNSSFWNVRWQGKAVKAAPSSKKGLPFKGNADEKPFLF